MFKTGAVAAATEPSTGTRSRQQLGGALIVTLALTATLEAIFYYGGIAGQRDDAPLRATAVAATVGMLTAVLMWLFNRAAFESGDAGAVANRSVVLGILAGISFAGFWIGVFGPFCVTAVLFGRKAAAAGETTKGYVGIGLGSLAFIASVIACLLGA